MGRFPATVKKVLFGDYNEQCSIICWSCAVRRELYYPDIYVNYEKYVKTMVMSCHGWTTNRQAEVGVDLRKLLVLLPMWISFVLGSTLGANLLGTQESRKVCRSSTPNSIIVRWSETIQIRGGFGKTKKGLRGEEFFFKRHTHGKKQPNWNWPSLWGENLFSHPQICATLEHTPTFHSKKCLDFDRQHKKVLTLNMSWDDMRCWFQPASL